MYRHDCVSVSVPTKWMNEEPPVMDLLHLSWSFRGLDNLKDVKDVEYHDVTRSRPQHVSDTTEFPKLIPTVIAPL